MGRCWISFGTLESRWILVFYIIATMILFILACVFASCLAAEFTLPGKCPNVTLQDNFDFSKVSVCLIFIKNTFFSSQ